jgi:hypothetical protein
MARASRSGSRKSPQAPSKSSQGLRYQKSRIVPNIGTMDRRLKLTSLMNELVSNAEREQAIDAGLLGSIRELQLRLQFALTSGGLTPPCPVPSIAPELFVNRPNKKENPIDFIRRVYGPWLDALSKDVIRRIDFALYTAYYRFKSSGGQVPTDFVLKSKKQKNDEELERRGFTTGTLDPDAREALRLLRLAKDRKRNLRPG